MAIQSVDIFCTVIDNFGDIGVCWRLAKQLQQQYHFSVRLWVDDLTSFAKLEPSLATHLNSQYCQNIEICYWSKDNFPSSIQPYEVVIEGFACRLPESFLQVMATQTIKPIWLNLEYLSAETWTLGCHGLVSPHPSLPLKQTFFFPSFDERGGGLLREAHLLALRDDFQQNPHAQFSFWQALGYADAILADYRLSLFAYENNAIPALLTALSQQNKRCFLAVPEGRSLANINTWINQTLRTGDSVNVGSLTVAVLPFLSPTQYDQLLWACDVNLVRGEDSFIRAHWAAQPLLWHIYQQEENTHLDKLEAWLNISKQFISEDWQNLQRAWVNENTDVTLWTTLLPLLATTSAEHRFFSASLGQHDDLCDKLVRFCTKHDAI